MRDSEPLERRPSREESEQPDSPSAESPSPDSPSPDSPANDSPANDSSAPDSSAPDSSAPDSPSNDSQVTGLWRWLVRCGLLVALAIVSLYLFSEYRGEFALDRLAEREEQFRQLLDHYPVWTYAAAFVLYVAVTALALPFAAVMSLVYGWLFGFWASLVLVSFASTAGATCSFALSRYILGDAIQARFGERLQAFNASLEREGPFFLFALRLVPLFPFFVINVVMGLTPIRVRTFWWVSQVGMLPGTVVYLFAGSSIKSLGELSRQGVASIITPQLIVAFVLLGLFPLAVKQVVAAVKRRRQSEQPQG
jgi:uncharacterized membrane protein YdjX (TVP38/TMEM64 family)